MATLDEQKKKELVEAGLRGRKRAYAPYSNYFVGAALLTEAGKIYEGLNIENASYGATVCAERVAIWKAVSEGEKEFDAIAVIGPSTTEAYPCAQCRQVMVEFGLDWLVISGDEKGNYLGEMTVGDLVPFAFTPDALLGDA